MIGMEAVGVVGGYHEALGYAAEIGGFVHVLGQADSPQGAMSTFLLDTLPGFAAHFFIVKEGQHRHGFGLLGSEKALQKAKHTLQIIQSGTEDPFLIGPKDGTAIPIIDEQVEGENILRGNPSLLGYQRQQLLTVFSQQR